MNFNFEPYPFEKYKDLIKNITPNEKLDNINLTIGEPKFDTPKIITDKIIQKISTLQSYPKTACIEELNIAQIDFVKRRFGVELKSSELISTLGTREVLFNFPQFYLFDKNNPCMVFTNPFYQIYEGAAKASKASVFHLDLKIENGFKPSIDKKILKDADLVIINFPNNPTGSELSLDELCEWVELSQEYNFLLINDECYSEIYVDTPPPSLLEASIKCGNIEFKNILVLNSISKRSSAPGLRSGFIAGDNEILSKYMLYRTYAGATAGLPMQFGAACAWSDDMHSDEIREKYKTNMLLAKEILGIPVSNSTFYLWLKVDDDLLTAQKLLKEFNINVIPGSFLSRGNAGKNYIRVALVEEPARTKIALDRLKYFFESN